MLTPRRAFVLAAFPGAYVGFVLDRWETVTWITNMWLALGLLLALSVSSMLMRAVSDPTSNVRFGLSMGGASACGLLILAHFGAWVALVPVALSASPALFALTATAVAILVAGLAVTRPRSDVPSPALTSR